MMKRVTLCSATLGEDGKVEPPLGALYIAAALEAVGVEVDFRDYQLEPKADCFDPENLAASLEGHAPVVAVSCFVGMLPVVIEATRLLHRNRPDTRFLLGGPGPSACADRLLELYPWIEGVVRGEGEETVQEWILAQQGDERDESIAGMSCRQGGSIVSGPPRRRIGNLAGLPRPAHHLIDWSAYSYASVISTRGCAYRCSFCDVTALWGNQSVYRDIDPVIDEMIELCGRTGWRRVMVVDDTFVQDRRRVLAFCDRLIDRRAGIAWSCYGRINLMSPSLLDRMAEAGCASIFYGIDSGSPRVLALTHKMVRREAVYPIVRHSAEVFDHVAASFIWGYPFEEFDDFAMTVDLAAEVSTMSPRVGVQLHMLCPLPNSPIYREFSGPLLEPEAEDLPWLLLPSLLLDPRAETIRRLVRSAPDVYPGFFTFPTPDKDRKRRLLERVIRSLNRTIGRSFLDEGVGRLLDVESPEQERELLAAEAESPERIGAGLAVGFFRRSRRRRVLERNPFEGSRRAALVRQANQAAPV